MPVDIEKEIKDNFSFIKKQCRMRAGSNSDYLFSIVLERIWKHRGNFNGENFKGWATTIIKNANIDLVRSPSFKYHFQDINELHNLKSDLNSNFFDSQFIDTIMETVKNKFSEKHNTIFTMRFVDGYKFHEIAKVMCIKEANTKLIIHRITKFLRSNKNLISIWKEN